METLVRTWGPAWLVMIADVDAASVITAARDDIKIALPLPRLKAAPVLAVRVN